MKVHLLTIGDELLIGQVVNTNASWLGEQLLLRGAEVRRMVTMPDELDVITRELHYAEERADLVIITGGLGPTHDDLTRDAIATYLKAPLELDEAVLEALRTRFSRYDKPMPERNCVQALVPAGCEVLQNPVGTAPGLWYQNGSLMLVALPGVPHEMKELMGRYVFPRIEKHERVRPIVQRTLLTTGIGESTLQESLGDTSGFLQTGQKLAYLPGIGGVRLRITASGQNPDEASEALKETVSYVRDRLEPYLFGTENDLLEAKIGDMLEAAGLTISTAESCTGGLIGDRITDVSGSSAYFRGGVIAYCNQVKREVLGVEESVLAEYGAVSKPVAMQMASGVRRLMKTDIGIASTGIMGPTGGTPEKPIGTVWIAYADNDNEWAVRVSTQKDRQTNKLYASAAALSMLWRKLRKISG